MGYRSQVGMSVTGTEEQIIEMMSTLKNLGGEASKMWSERNFDGIKVMFPNANSAGTLYDMSSFILNGENSKLLLESDYIKWYDDIERVCNDLVLDNHFKLDGYYVRFGEESDDEDYREYGENPYRSVGDIETSSEELEGGEDEDGESTTYTANTLKFDSKIEKKKKDLNKWITKKLPIFLNKQKEIIDSLKEPLDKVKKAIVFEREDLLSEILSENKELFISEYKRAQVYDLLTNHFKDVVCEYGNVKSFLSLGNVLVDEAKKINVPNYFEEAAPSLRNAIVQKFNEDRNGLGNFKKLLSYGSFETYSKPDDIPSIASIFPDFDVLLQNIKPINNILAEGKYWFGLGNKEYILNFVKNSDFLSNLENANEIKQYFKDWLSSECKFNVSQNDIRFCEELDKIAEQKTASKFGILEALKEHVNTEEKMDRSSKILIDKFFMELALSSSDKNINKVKI